ncbi:excinuclease ABC subunit UvrA [Rickettsiella grylli]|uniref:UvrABC system protein A n=1 Tax=Rickettsiella grylli TaxID=59196 RepID=A8PMM2_9COXI|nr:excinuclease ABC subunit UvrA [Rickettsiella grylli]EDP46436.1 excinuclease ABC, A subunit [Rickettsiella grylli]
MHNIIRIQGARTHNLQNINLTIPRDQLIVVTGLSGSGKSSLAFDTLYAEGQRRYVESLSSYARQFLSMMEKPDVDHIEGLSPAIAIDQKSTSHNPRSTVGTVTEIYDYLRVLFARIGEPQCPFHHISLAAQSITQMVDTLMALPNETRLFILAPKVQERKGEFKPLLDELRSQGYLRARIDGRWTELDQVSRLNAKQKHSIEVVVDRLKIKPDNRLRLSESLATAASLSEGLVIVVLQDSSEKKQKELVFSERFACPECGYSLSALEPRLFSFNNPSGACPQCDGLGHELIFDPEKVIPNPELSIAHGAIVAWDSQNPYYWALLSALAQHYHFSLESPFNVLPAHVQKIILHGSGKEEIKFHYESEKGYVYRKKKPFEGVLPTMQRRYKETESDSVREDLAYFLASKPCSQCQGTRLNAGARHVFIDNKTISDWVALPLDQLKVLLEKLNLSGQRAQIALGLQKEIIDRLTFLIDVGLNYLSLERSADTLSGGEAQRIRLASQIGSGLVGVMYILDEPSIGLHQRDNSRLLSTLLRLRDLGNTVIVVEHDEEAIRHADFVVDMGPGAGAHGGCVIAQGSPAAIIRNPHSLTGQYLSGERRIECPKKRIKFDKNRVIKLVGASGNNLKQINVEIPLGLMTCVTGVSGSGKSTLINDTLYPIAARKLNAAILPQAAPYQTISGFEQLDKVIDIDQSPIGRTPRSNPATYIGLLTPIRELFAATPEARSRGYKAGRFSFNVKGGRCEACEGDGVLKVEMHFLADVYVQCDVCKGQRYNRETLEIVYKGKNIYQILEMTVEEASVFFSSVPVLARKLQTLIDVGLAYLHLGQRAPTLSGGEAQRVKLAKELSKRDTGQTLYILDEPTTGLHFYDIEQLLKVLYRLRDRGNTVVIIEHNLDVIKTADWIIDLGPEGGSKGGEIVCVGTPLHVAKQPHSYTGQYLKPLFGKRSLSSENGSRHG